MDAAASALDQLSGVLIATPTASHAPLVRWAIGKKVPCFVEKPLTLNVKNSDELTTLADAAGVPVQVGFVMHHEANLNRDPCGIRQSGQLVAILDIQRQWLFNEARYFLPNRPTN